MIALERIFLTDDRRVPAITIGLMVGILGALTALLIVFAGIVPAFGLMIGALVGLYLLTSLDAALIVVLATVALLPFGTFPVKIAFTPSLIDCALAGFLTVYLFQWMTGRRRAFTLTPPSWAIIAFMLVMIFAFVMGTGHSRPTMNLLKTFLELLLAISMALILADVASDITTLRRVVLILLAAGTLSALVGIVLWVLPDATAEQILNRLGRFGYPVGGVIRYRVNNVEVLNERAIGTWIDPNAYSGFLIFIGAMTGSQLFSRVPVTRWRWLALICFGVVGTALFLSDSRGSFLGLAAGLGLIAVLRYRRVLWLMGLAGLLILLLPQTQHFVDRLIAGFTAADLETQMRLGEYKDALTLIGRYPVFGVGFSGVPEIDLYVAFSSTYLTIAAYAGFVGLAAYLIAVGSTLWWGIRCWQAVKQDEYLVDVWLGLLAGIVGASIGAIVDHFYFNPQYQATATMFWSFIGLFLAASRLKAMSQQP